MIIFFVIRPVIIRLKLLSFSCRSWVQKFNFLTYFFIVFFLNKWANPTSVLPYRSAPKLCDQDNNILFLCQDFSLLSDLVLSWLTSVHSAWREPVCHDRLQETRGQSRETAALFIDNHMISLYFSCSPFFPGNNFLRRGDGALWWEMNWSTRCDDFYTTWTRYAELFWYSVSYNTLMLMNVYVDWNSLGDETNVMES